jgi:hypothetical protein
MIGTLRFELMDIADLAKELAVPIASISIGLDASGRASSLTLWRIDRSGIRINSVMKDVAEQFELPVLRLQRRENDFDKGGVILQLGDKPTTVSAVYKLVMEDEAYSEEAGLLLIGNPALRVTILPDSFPYSLSISGVPGFHLKSDPEWPFEAFKLVRIV